VYIDEWTDGGWSFVGSKFSVSLLEGLRADKRFRSIGTISVSSGIRRYKINPLRIILVRITRLILR